MLIFFNKYHHSLLFESTVRTKFFKSSLVESSVLIHSEGISGVRLYMKNDQWCHCLSLLFYFLSLLLFIFNTLLKMRRCFLAPLFYINLISSGKLDKRERKHVQQFFLLCYMTLLSLLGFLFTKRGSRWTPRFQPYHG